MTIIDVTRRPPLPRPPARRLVYVAPAPDVEEALAHRTGRRSSQELDTALLEVKDAAVAVRANCPMTDAVQLDPETQAHIDAAHLRLDTAVIRAVAAGATTDQIHVASNGAVR